MTGIDSSDLPGPIVRWLPGNRSTGVHATRVRGRIPARLLRQAGVDARLLRRREEPAQAQIDLLVLQDPLLDDQALVAKRAATAGIAVTVDLSDPALARTDIARRCVASATAVTVRHPAMEALVEHDDVTAIDDAVEWAHPSPQVRMRPSPSEPARLVWFGLGAGRSADTGVNELETIRPSLEAMAARRRLELVVLTEDRAGAASILRSGTISGRWVDWSPWRLRSVLAAAHVCLLPSGPEEAGRFRSASRAITALNLGVPVVAGAVPAYEALGGSVCFGAWDTNVDRLLADQTDVEALVGRGRDAIRTRFGDAAIAHQWRSMVRDTLDQLPTATSPSSALASA